MNRFYPVLVKAIAALPENSKETRLDVYGAARSIARRTLNDMHPKLEERDAACHLDALEKAIRDLERAHSNMRSAG